MGRQKAMVIHDFYCLSCGKKGLPLPRKESLKTEQFHRKRMYCIFCRRECNHIECKTQEEVFDFRERFEKGEFQKEAEVSLEYCNE